MLTRTLSPASRTPSMHAETYSFQYAAPIASYRLTAHELCQAVHSSSSSSARTSVPSTPASESCSAASATLVGSAASILHTCPPNCCSLTLPWLSLHHTAHTRLHFSWQRGHQSAVALRGSPRVVTGTPMLARCTCTTQYMKHCLNDMEAAATQSGVSKCL